MIKDIDVAVAEVPEPTRWNRLMNECRRFAKATSLGRFIQIFRRILYFGPWRVVPIAIIRTYRSALYSEQTRQSPSLLGDIDAAYAAKQIHDESLYIAGMLPAAFVDRLRSITDNLPKNEYKKVHEINRDVLALAEDPRIQDVLHQYFGCRPELLEASLYVGGESNQPTPHSHFHIDYAGWHSLNVFVYLTDMGESQPHHVVIRGSHRNHSLRDMIHGEMDAQMARERFGDAITPIVGRAGTVFFESTEAYHARHSGWGRRVLLSLLFAPHRGLLNYGRASKRQLEMRNTIFADITKIVD